MTSILQMSPTLISPVYFNINLSFVESPIKKILKKAELKAKKKGKDSKEQIQDESTELYPIEEMLELTETNVLVM